ncbi:MAG TPA: T9SS type A sorting domain-containing protein [Bacteroidales bacterium]|nr:T9SS type A sorting domain-containing protein [Bacteroidales bacterium]
MKKTLFYLIFLCLSITFATAQDNIGGTPPSFIYSNLPTNIDFVQVPSPDLNKLAAEDYDRNQKSEPYRIGVTLPVDFSLDNSGTWTDLPGEEAAIWRLTVRSEGAKAIGFGYSSFYMPDGAKLFLYNKDKSKITGAYTALNNSDNYFFSNDKIKGDEITLELFVPNDKRDAALLHITDLDYFYRPGENNTIKDADTCEININCPEGSNWQNEKKGVCLIDIKTGGDWYNCTGSLVNNTSQNCTPYVLLADHCIYSGSAYPTASECNAWRFYFHYEATLCNGTSPSGTFLRTGCTLKAHDTYGSTNNGSDFCLVQINAPIPNTLGVYYNGWDHGGNGSTSGVSIHHPQADIMKISTFTTSLASINYGATGSHWRVVWAQTETHHGVTEQGSSGSPLFNSTKKIIGTLTGGGSFCDTPTQPDFYGKFFYHWDKNGTTSAKQLKPWLDPENTGVASLAGKAASTCPSDIGISELNTNEEKININPSPAQNEIVIKISSPENKIENVMIYNIMGVAVKNIPVLNMESLKATIDISDLAEGVYYMTAQKGKTIFKGEFVKIK